MKRLLSLITVITVFLSLFIVSAAAADTPVIEIDNKSVNAGNTVSLDVKIRNNPGVTSMYMDVYYDKALTLVRAEDTGLLGGALFAEDIKSYPYRISWDESSMKAANGSDGVVVRLVFSVPSDAENGRYDVDIRYDKEEVYGYTLKNVFFEVKKGSVTVTEKLQFAASDKIKPSSSCLFFIAGTRVSELLGVAPDGTVVSNSNTASKPGDALKSGDTAVLPDGSTFTCVCFGDVDGDGRIKAADARKTLRASVNLETPFSWQQIAADVDFSGNITASDARYILRASVALEDAKRWFYSVSSDILYLSESKSVSAEKPASDKNNFQLAGEYLTSELKNFNKDINIYKYSVSVDDAYSLVSGYVQNVPSLFYVGSTVNVTYVGNILKSLHFSFCDNAEEKCRDYEKRISEITALADNRWSEVETVLFYHDYIASNFSYDTDYEIHDAYSILVNKKGVCQAYSLLFSELVGRHGIEVQYVTSGSMVHGWNVVKIGEFWYHVDVTWDDPLYDRFGLVQHNNVLLSDKAIKKNGHTSWNFSSEYVSCTDTTYDSYFWKDVTSPFVQYEDVWYYVVRRGNDVALCKTDLLNKFSVLAEFESFWMDGYDHYWNGCYSGLVLRHGELIFNTSDQIIAYSPHSDKTKVVYVDTTPKSIYGVMVDGSVLYNLNSAPDAEKHNVLRLDIPVPGDADKNGVFNAKDVTVMIRSINGHSVIVDEKAADMDFDGRISLSDSDVARKIIVNKY